MKRYVRCIKLIYPGCVNFKDLKIGDIMHSISDEEHNYWYSKYSEHFEKVVQYNGEYLNIYELRNKKIDEILK